MKIQKVIWHVRWALLIGIMLFNVIGFSSAMKIEISLPVNGFVFAFYFLLKQIEGYYKCKSSCNINK